MCNGGKITLCRKFAFKQEGGGGVQQRGDKSEAVWYAHDCTHTVTIINPMIHPVGWTIGPAVGPDSPSVGPVASLAVGSLVSPAVGPDIIGPVDGGLIVALAQAPAYCIEMMY